MAATENRLRYAAALMMAAEQADLTLSSRPNGRIFVSGEDGMVGRMLPELNRFRAEISYLLSHARMQSDALIDRVRYVPTSSRIRRQGAVK